MNKYEQEEMNMIMREYHTQKNIDKQKQIKKSWKPWHWNWQTLIFWTVIALIVRVIVYIMGG